jgi:hypothetical protein
MSSSISHATRLSPVRKKCQAQTHANTRVLKSIERLLFSNTLFIKKEVEKNTTLTLMARE